jgi:release factor glutamine methyltransferase
MSTPGRTPGRSERFVGGWVSLRDVLADAERRLAAAGVPSPQNDALVLAAHVKGVPKGRLLLHDEMPSEERTAFERLIARRMSRVPLQHLIGSAAFRTIDVGVGPGVFIPRPETELLAGAAIDFLRSLPPRDRRAVDLCTGSGAVALAVAIEVGSVDITAVEVDSVAARWARDNVLRLGDDLAAADSHVRIVQADACDCAADGGPLAAQRGTVSVVTMNPPYVPDDAQVRDPEVRDHDPALALYGGSDGLEVIRGALETAATLLRAGGFVAIEHSDEQGEDAQDGVPALLREDSRWRDVQDHLDLNRRPRYTTAIRTV